MKTAFSKWQFRFANFSLLKQSGLFQLEKAFSCRGRSSARLGRQPRESGAQGASLTGPPPTVNQRCRSAWRCGGVRASPQDGKRGRARRRGAKGPPRNKEQHGNATPRLAAEAAVAKGRQRQWKAKETELSANKKKSAAAGHAVDATTTLYGAATAHAGKQVLFSSPFYRWGTVCHS